MDSDVKSTNVTASGSIFGGPARIKGWYIIDGASAGSVVFRDGGASGTVVCTIDTPGTATGHQDFTVPGNGIRCDTDVYVTVTNAASVTVFYA